MQKYLLGYDVGYRFFIFPSSFMEPAVVPSILQAQETALAVSSLLLNDASQIAVVQICMNRCVA